MTKGELGLIRLWTVGGLHNKIQQGTQKMLREVYTEVTVLLTAKGIDPNYMSLIKNGNTNLAFNSQLRASN